MEPNSLQLEFDVVKGLKVDENWISSGRRKGNKEWSYAEAVKSGAENKVEENLFTINDKWVSNERDRRKCKRSNIEKMKLDRTGISKCGDEKSGVVKNNVGNFNSLNLNFSSIMSNLLE